MVSEWGLGAGLGVVIHEQKGGSGKAQCTWLSWTHRSPWMGFGVDETSNVQVSSRKLTRQETQKHTKKKTISHPLTNTQVLYSLT